MLKEKSILLIFIVIINNDNNVIVIRLSKYTNEVQFKNFVLHFYNRPTRRCWGEINDLLMPYFNRVNKTWISNTHME